MSRVNNLLTRFAEAQKMMKQMGKGGESLACPAWVAVRSPRTPGQSRQKVEEGSQRKPGEAGGARGRGGHHHNAAPGSGLLGGDFRPGADAASLEGLPPEFQQLVGDPDKKN